MLQIIQAKLTGYYPHNDPMEGGIRDAMGMALQTIQGYLAGLHNTIMSERLVAVTNSANYISVAADEVVPIGTLLWFPELDKHYNHRLPFKVCDRGGAFRGKGLTRFDICCATEQDTLDDYLNRPQGHIGVIYTG